MRNSYLSILIFCILISSFSCQQYSGENKKFIFKAGHVANTDHTWHKGFEYFAKLIKERSGGRIEVQLYPQEQLGKEVEIIRCIQAGIADMTISGGTLQN